MTRDKKRVELGLKETETIRKDCENDVRVKEVKLKALELTADSEMLALAELHYKLSLSTSMLAISEKKVAKYERYIQTNFKDKH